MANQIRLALASSEENSNSEVIGPGKLAVIEIAYLGHLEIEQPNKLKSKFWQVKSFPELISEASVDPYNRYCRVDLEGLKITDPVADLLSFIHDRLKVHMRDEGIRHDVIDACLAMPGSDDLTLLTARAEALAEVLETEDGENLVQGFKRANNILTQAEERDGVEYSFGADAKFAEDPTETALIKAIESAEKEIGPAMRQEDFRAAMAAMARLRQPIDAFFEAVQVNSENQIVRRNRLNLLNQIRDICLQVADLRKIEG